MRFAPQAPWEAGTACWRPLATDFPVRWPTLHKVQKARPETLKQFYHLHGSRSQKLIDQRLGLVAKAVALTRESALMESFAMRIQLVCKELRMVVAAIKDFDRQIARTFASHPDHRIFHSLPGAGPVLAPRLLASLGSRRQRFPASHHLQHYSGIASVTKQSGGKRHVHRRYLCSRFRRQGSHEYARESVLWRRWPDSTGSPSSHCAPLVRSRIIFFAGISLILRCLGLVATSPW